MHVELKIGEWRVPPVTALLAAANLLVFLVLEAMGSTEDAYFMYLHGALYGPAVLEGSEYYRLFTAMFLHFGVSHLMNNLFMLVLIGQRLEQVAGSLRTLVIYLASGLGANLFTVWFYTWRGSDAVSAGASGALMGVVGGLLACIVKSRKNLAGLSRRQMMILIALSLYSGFATGANNTAHISGLAFGFLAAWLLYWPGRERV